ncbi:MAG: SpoIIE family protein phosphatase [Treponema sp.]|nr:SpoIIE family protein phosphatase [Treponema sp.]
MTFDDNYAYIPLFATAAAGAILFVLLIFVKHKKTARVSLITLLADLLLVAASLAGGIKNLNAAGDNAFVLTAFIIFIGAFIFIPYSVILLTFEPRKFDKLVPPSLNRLAARALASEEKKEEEPAAAELTQADTRLLDISAVFMAQANKAFSSDEDGMSQLLDYINKTISAEIKADGGAILMVDDFDDVITVKSFDGDFPPPYKLPSDMPHKPVRVATNFKFASFPLRDNLFGEVATAGKPELITRPELDSRIYQNGPEEFLECGSYIVVPLKNNDNVIGVTAFARRHGAELFTENELNVAVTLSEFASAAILNVLSVKEIIEHSELSKEANIASRIQDMLRPAKLPAVQGAQLGSIWTPADGVCGDYYDIIVSRKDRISFVMSDIAGKGINSCIVMSMMHAMVRLVVNTRQSTGTILSWVNRGIAGESFSADHFGSCALINYNPELQNIEFSTGGTTPIYYFDSATKRISRISEASEPIGVEKSTEYKDFVQKVKSGDIIITCTDGLTETLNESGQQYTEERLLKIVASSSASSGKDIANTVKADIKNFCGNAPQHDDRTLLVIKIK